MKFVKMQGCGNDYVYFDGRGEIKGNRGEIAKTVSDRHFGVGSDGAIFINNSKKADFEMEMYNADGSRAEMCGNGIRCVGKYVYDNGWTEKTKLSIETLAGIKYLDLKVEEGEVKRVTVDMGKPELHACKIPVISKNQEVIGEEIEVDGECYKMTCISMGNPHAVIFVDNVAELDLEKIGPSFESHHCFPKRINTEFAQVINPSLIEMRVWERGSGETLACGTGACATVVAACLNKLALPKARIRLLGGELDIEWDEERNKVYMTGPATTVFFGEMKE